ncbi:MAG: hypothetical protein ACE15C_16435 [Phycisphaerae bacterium]
MNVRRQIESLREAANQLTLSGADVRHCESGIRGELIVRQAAGTARDPLERFDFARPMMEFALRGFMRRLLCGGQDAHIVEEPWRTPGFPFAAVDVGRQPAGRGRAQLDGIGHSFIYGDQEAIGRLAQLVAAPAVGYLSKSPGGRARYRDSRRDPMSALGEWVYIIYDIGRKTGDCSLRPYYRLVMPLGANNHPDDVITGFEDDASLTKGEFRHPRLWDIIWSAGARRELGFGRLGLNLVVASRIALDHLLDMKLKYEPPPRSHGAPRQYSTTQDRKLMEEWAQKRGKAGLTRKEFCEGKMITVGQFIQAQDRQRKQRALTSQSR